MYWSGISEPNLLTQLKVSAALVIGPYVHSTMRFSRAYLLSFENFAVCCGPDLYVFLASNPSPAGHADLGDYLELSSLKASTGDQDYEIPADTDLSQIKSVVIYCKPCQVIISTATLS